MDLVNETPFAAHLFRGVLDEDLLLALVVCRTAFAIGRDGKLSAEEAEEVREEPIESPAGHLEEDSALVKPGIDVVVLGDAIAPRGRKVRETTVALRVGNTSREVRVLGKRVWEPARGRSLDEAIERSLSDDGHDLTALSASRPEPFERIPVTWSHAFGGVAESPEGKVPYGPNPQGMGYHLHLGTAVGAELPRLEDPSRPIAHWRDWVDPVCLAPLRRDNSVRMSRGVVTNEEDLSFEVTPAFFSVAPPGQCFSELAPDTEIMVEGMNPDGATGFRMPDISPMLSVKLGDESAELSCTLDTVEIWPNERRVCFVSRAPFRYWFRPGEERTATLRLSRGRSL